MIHLLSWLPSGIVSALGWTLVHFLWQGLALAVLLQMVMAMAQSARVRHNWALAVLVMMAAAPIATFLLVHRHETGAALPGGGNALQRNGGALPILANAAFPAGEDYTSAFTAMAAPWIDWLVAFWLAGVALLGARAAGGWYLAEILRRRETFALPADTLERIRKLQRGLLLTGPVQYLQSHRVDVPTVIGWFRPVILLPISAVAGLPPQQLEALVMHELAHIQRHDALINMLLLAVETILFYHPAVWWVGRRIRIERENCCDDLAVSRCGDASVYVEALTSLEAGRGVAAHALAANGGKLRDRVARLLGVPSASRGYCLPAIAGLAIVSLVVGTVAMGKPAALTANALARALPAVSTRIAALAAVSPLTAGAARAAAPLAGRARPISMPVAATTMPVVGNRIVAMVDGRPISEYDLQQRVQLAAALSPDKLTDADIKRLRSDSLKQLEEEAVEREAARKAHVTVDPAEIDRQIDAFLAAKKMTPDQFRKALAESGSSESTLRDRLVAQAAWEKVAVMEHSADTGTGGRPGQVAEAPRPLLAQPAASSSARDAAPWPDEMLSAPPYPAISRRLGEQGTTVLRLSVNRTGGVTGAVVLASSGSARLDQAAVDWARAKWHFPPATKAPARTVTQKVRWRLLDAGGHQVEPITASAARPVTISSGKASSKPNGMLSAPPYPTISRRLGEQGITILALSVTPTGEVAGAAVSKSSGAARLDQAAVAWARANWHFPPAANAQTASTRKVTEKVAWRLLDVR